MFLIVLALVVVAAIVYFVFYPVFAFLALLFVMAANLGAHPFILYEIVCGDRDWEKVDEEGVKVATFIYGLATVAMFMFAMTSAYQQYPYNYVGFGAATLMLIVTAMLLNYDTKSKRAPHWSYNIIEPVAAVLAIVYTGRILLMKFGIVSPA